MIVSHLGVSPKNNLPHLISHWHLLLRVTQTHTSTSAATLKVGVGSSANPSCDDDARHHPAHPQPSPLLSQCHGLRLTELLNSCLTEEPHGSYGRYRIILLILEELSYCFHSGDTELHSQQEWSRVPGPPHAHHHQCPLSHVIAMLTGKSNAL